MAQNEQTGLYSGSVCVCVYPLRFVQTSYKIKNKCTQSQVHVTKLLTVIVYSGSQTKAQSKAFFKDCIFKPLT